MHSPQASQALSLHVEIALMVDLVCWTPGVMGCPVCQELSRELSLEIVRFLMNDIRGQLFGCR